MGTRIYRVIVRGQFDGLTDDQAAALRARADEHDLLGASFTPEGSFVYSPALTWFNLRLERRSTDEADPEGEVEALARQAMEDLFARLGLRHKHLRVVLTDMNAMWE